MIFAGLGSPIGRAVGMGFEAPVTEADFDQAIGLQSGLQRAAKSAAISSSEYAQLAQEETKEPRFPAENAVNAVLQGSSFAQDRI